MQNYGNIEKLLKKLQNFSAKRISLKIRGKTLLLYNESASDIKGLICIGDADVLAAKILRYTQSLEDFVYFGLLPGLDKKELRGLLLRFTDSRTCTELIKNITSAKKDAEKRKSENRRKRSKMQRNTEFSKWFFNNVRFPGEADKGLAPEFEALEKMRCVKAGRRNYSGSLMSDGNVLEYESETEKEVIEKFLNMRKVVGIKTQSVKIPYIYQGRNTFYFPDLALLTDEGHIIIVEVKSFCHFAYYRNILKYRALHAFCQRHGYGYTVIDNEKHCIFSITPDKTKEKLVIKALEKKNSLNYAEISKLKERYAIGHRELVAIAIKNGLVFLKNPLHLSKPLIDFNGFLS